MFLNTFILSSTLLVLIVATSQCPQLCSDCSNGQCNTCKSGFEYAASNVYPADPCGCPQGMFLNPDTNLCNFCPARCTSCTSQTQCDGCLYGYYIDNGQCIWDQQKKQSIEVSLSLNNQDLLDHISGKIYLEGSAITGDSTLYFTQCQGMVDQPFYGRRAFDVDTKIIKTYFGLPYHDWALLKISYVIVDDWKTDKFIVDIQEGKSQRWTVFDQSRLQVERAFLTSNLTTDFCGLSDYPDALGLYNYSFSHTNSVLKFKISVLANDSYSQNIHSINFGIRDVLLVVGVCHPHCQTCVSDKLCFTCKPLYTRNTDYFCVCDSSVAIDTSRGCIKKCQSDEVFDSVEQQCYPCNQYISGCENCQNSTCIECELGYFLHDGECFAVCPFGYVKSKNSTTNIHECLQCSMNCEACTPSQCLSCNDGYFLEDGVCVDNCSQGTFPEPVFGICEECPYGCLECNSFYNCLVCENSTEIQFYNLFGACQILCQMDDLVTILPIPGSGFSSGIDFSSLYYHIVSIFGCPLQCDNKCQTCFGEDDDECLSCIHPFYLQDHTCVQGCSPGYYEDFTHCVPCRDGCSECNFYECTSCETGYYHLDGHCLKECPVGFYSNDTAGTCEVCSAGCHICFDDSICQDCEHGLIKKDGQCVDDHGCSDGHYVDPLTLECESCPEDCDICHLSLCLVCDDDTYLNNGECVDECPRDKYPKGGRCQWKNPLCQEYAQNGTGQCLECLYLDPPLILGFNCTFSCPEGMTTNFSSQQCTYPCPQNCLHCKSIAICVECDQGWVIGIDGSCVRQCATGEMDDHVQCLECHSGCAVCQLDGICLQCEFGLQLNPFGVCEHPNCPTSHFLNSTAGTCQACDPYCKTCYDGQYACTSCPDGKFRQGEYCRDQCSDGYFQDYISRQCRKCSPLCSKCQSFMNCTECLSGFYLHGDKCLQECPPGFYIAPIDNTNYLCLHCHENCQTCFGESVDQCITCFKGYKKDKTRCVHECPLYQYEDFFSHCEECHELCQRCWGPAEFQCLNCTQGTYLHEGYCLKDCPPATFIQSTLRLCQLCPYKCHQCLNSTICEICFSGFVLDGGHCYDECPATMYQVGSTCQQCDLPNCQICTDFGLCLYCEDDYWNFLGDCVDDCPVSTFEITYPLDLCIPCSMHCRTCDRYDYCKECHPPFVEVGGVCAYICDLGFVHNPTTQECDQCGSNCAGCSSTTQCSSCNDGYYLQDGNCVENCSSSYFPTTIGLCVSCPPSCLACTSTSGCTACMTGYNLSTTGICINETYTNCTDKCLNCSDASSCYYCMVPYYLLGGSCLTSCPDGYYTQGRECHPCNSTCSQCNLTAQNCTNCKPGFYLFEHKCIPRCPAGYFSLPTQQCEQCQPNCALCTQNYWCLKCYNNLLPINGNCEDQCPTSTYFDHSVSTCLNCSEHCVRCLSYESCVECSHEKFLVDGHCKAKCPAGTYITGVRECAPCKLQCAECNNFDACTSCAAGFHLNGTSCVSWCGEGNYAQFKASTNSTICKPCSTNCKSCQTNSTICTSCRQGYFLDGIKCMVDCPSSSYMSADGCKPCSPFCQICHSYDECELCHPSLTLFQGQCVSMCPEGYANITRQIEVWIDNKVVSHCQKCVAPCKTCSQVNIYSCESCLDEYFLNNTRCFKKCPYGWFSDTQARICRQCPDNCLNCTSFNNCTECDSGVTLVNGRCQSPNACTNCNCSSQCQDCLSGVCYLCHDGYVLNDGNCLTTCPNSTYQDYGMCVDCSNDCLRCYSRSHCVECASGSFKYNGMCVQVCPDGTIQSDTAECVVNYCSSVDGSNTCLSCISPYFLSEGVCVNACPVGSYQTTTSCQSCPQQCFSCQSYTNCTECKPNYFQYEGECYVNCPLGTYSSQLMCMDCNQTCLTCVTATQCSKCISGTYLLNGVCYSECPAKYYEGESKCLNCSQNCVECDNGECWHCESPYFLLNGSCVMQCKNGTFQLITTAYRMCQYCPSECVACSSFQVCESCIFGYYLSNGACIENCPPSTYPSTSFTCQTCASPCQLCLSQNQCLMCSSGFLWNKQCVTACPNGTFPLDQQCKQCSPNCQNCAVSATTCTGCYSGMTLSNGRCVSQCPARQYSNGTGCFSCSLQCYECHGPHPDQCLSCEYGLVLLYGQCVEFCPHNMFVESGKCTFCSEICRMCSMTPSNCTQCHSNYYLHENGCYEKCPDGYYGHPNGYCASCHADCATCDGPSSSDCMSCSGTKILTASSECTDNCPTGMVVLNGVCEHCPFFECVRCNANFCQECSAEYRTYLGECVKECPAQHYANSTRGCSPCSNTACLYCNPTGQCIDCPYGKFLEVGSCVDSCSTGYELQLGECVPKQGCAMYVVEGTEDCVSYCEDGYYLNGTECQKCSHKCEICLDDATCEKCLSGFFYHQGSCMSYCPAGYVAIENACHECQDPCQTCSGTTTSCRSCNQAYLLGDQCLAACPSGMYSTTAGVCLQCPDKCLQCNETHCSSCKNSLYAAPDCTSDSQNTCSSGYQDATGCHSCNNSCATCYGPAEDNCLTCPTSKVYSQGRCLDNCPLNRYESSGECRLCSTLVAHCGECTNNQCLKCQTGYFMYNGQCYGNCSELNNQTHVYTHSTSANTCTQCPLFCESCESGVCTECLETYVLYNQQCLSVCVAETYESDGQCMACSPPCLECTSASNCTSCFDSAKYLHNNQCVDQCPDSTYPLQKQCKECSIANCKTCQYDSSSSILHHCTQCQFPYTLVNGLCGGCVDGYFSSSGECQRCNSTCATCQDGAGCLTCITGLIMHNGQCITICPQKYYLPPSGTACVACSDNNCLQCTSSTCQKCASTHILHNGQCVSSCPAAYYRLSNRCQACSTGCNVCQTATSCEQCSPNYFKYESRCVNACPSGTTDVSGECSPCKTGCKVCTNSTNNCTQCQNNLIAQNDGSCAPDPTTNCPTGEYQENGNCYSCYQLCGQCYGGSPNQCTTCRSTSHVLNTQGYCESVCSSRQYLSNNLCVDCDPTCKECDSNGCLSCDSGKYLHNAQCVNPCPTTTYIHNQKCASCPSNCDQCSDANTCTNCGAAAPKLYNGQCYNNCPQRTYPSGTTCVDCPSQCFQCTSSTVCSSCNAGFVFHNNECRTDCPSSYWDNSGSCAPCKANCTECQDQATCDRCDSTTFLYNNSCQSTCPTGTTPSNGVCQNCSSGCRVCSSTTYCSECDAGMLMIEESSSSARCVSSCPSGYEQLGTDCVSENCIDCDRCVNAKCQQCNNVTYLFNDKCEDACPISYFGNQTTRRCSICIDNCEICPNSTYCETCVTGYNYTTDNGCVDEAYLQFGVFANMSSFTSNITEITATVYLSTSVGPVVFGQIASTYFNIEFCQFLLFHDNAAGENKEMKQFLESLSYMAGTGNVSNTAETTRRMLQETSSLSFLEANMFVFILMGAFLALYIIISIIQRNIQDCCLSCPKLNFYANEICIYMQKRFKWIYFDFVVWLSYLPFLYFALIQVQNMSFSTALLAISSILSVIIIIVYPLYPLFILYHLKKNYKAICLENDKMVEMSLNPWINKVKRPTELSEDEFSYCTKENWRLVYYALKYFRKFIFVLIIAVVQVPTISLSVLIGLNIVFIGYMAALRPRQMPYMVFDFIIEGVLLGFQIFMLVYISIDQTRVSAMSIVTQAVGFITANFSIIVAIILNLIAYYHIIKCIYDLVIVLREKMDEKEKNDMKEKDQLEGENIQEMNSDSQDHIYNHQLEKQLLRDNIKKVRNDDSATEEDVKTENLSDEERKIAKLMTDKDLMINGIQPRFDDIEHEDIQQLEKEMLRENIRKVRNDDSATEEDVKTQNLSDDERNIAKMMTDKDLMINGIQPRINENIEHEDINQLEKQLLRENIKKVRNDDSGTEEDVKTENLEDEERNIAKLMTDKDLMINGIQPRMDEHIEQSDDINNLFNDKELYNETKKHGGDEDEDQNELPTIKAHNKKKDKKKKQKDTEKDLYGEFENTNTRLAHNESDLYQRPKKSKNPTKIPVIGHQPAYRNLKESQKKVEEVEPKKKKGNFAQVNQNSSGEGDFFAPVRKQNQRNPDELNEKNLSNLTSNESLVQGSTEQIKLLEKNKKKEEQKVKGKRSVNEFDDFIEDLNSQERKKENKKKEQYEPKDDDVDVSERVKNKNKESSKSKKDLHKDDPLNEGKMKERQKKGQAIDPFEREGQINEGEFYDAGKKKSSAQTKQEKERLKQIQMRERQRIIKERLAYEQGKTDKNISEGQFNERNPKKQQLKNTSEQIQKQPEELEGVERKKKEKKGFFFNIFGGDSDKEKEEKNTKPNVKEIGDYVDFQESNDSSKKAYESKKSQKKGNLAVNENVSEEYEDIKRKNKDNMVKPKKGTGKMKYNQEEEFVEDRIQRPSGRNSKANLRDEGLVVENRSEASDAEDIGVNRMRKRIQQGKKNRKGPMNLNQKSGSFDEDFYQRPQKDESQKNSSRLKHGLLKINKNQESQEEDDLENIQL